MSWHVWNLSTNVGDSVMGDILRDPRFCVNHQWEDAYYGTICALCGLFYPNGCAPWEDGLADGSVEMYVDEDW